jgi:hypothetical protein
MAPAKEELDAFDEWLGVDFESIRGKTVSLFEPVKEALQAAFKDGSISMEDDVPEDGIPLSSAEVTDFNNFLYSAFEDYAEDGVPKAMCKFKLKAWVQARFGEQGVNDALFNLGGECGRGAYGARGQAFRGQKIPLSL